MKVAIIGAGWYGCHLASVFKRRIEQVDVFERGDDIFGGASSFNQNRLHQGFHYPRCKTTRNQSKRGYHLFKKHYPGVILEPDYNLYGVPSKGSRLDFETYKDIMSASGLRYEDVTDVSPFPLSNIAGLIDCEESVIVPELAKKYFQEKLYKNIFLKSEVDEEKLKCLSDEYDYVIDCTWGGVGFEKDHYYEPCIYFIAKSQHYKNMGLTLMDGDLFSIYPCDSVNHTVTHVKHTPLGRFKTQEMAREFIRESKNNEDLIIAKKESFTSAIEEYFPTFSKEFEFTDVRFAVKTKVTGDLDSRYVTILRDKNVIKVNSGKIDTVFDAEALVMREIFG